MKDMRNKEKQFLTKQMSIIDTSGDTYNGRFGAFGSLTRFLPTPLLFSVADFGILLKI